MWEDNLDRVSNEFNKRRTIDLHNRFSGWYRAIVEETNDPLNIRRVRVRIPELHDIDTEIKKLPWAIPAPWHGGINAGSFTNPAIKDIVYVCFEKNHPYVPIYCAAPDSTRRRAYPLWSTYTKTPLAVKEDGTPDSAPDDFEQDYLPKDGRPMSMGFVDRYGNYLLFNAHGFFPTTHKSKPTPAGVDALSQKEFDILSQPPNVNDPDLKYIAFGTKYGHSVILGDQGYQWDKEFKGDLIEDEVFEIDRYKYLLKHHNEQKEKDRDQRRIELRTRLGHKFEMRDVGWDKSRSGEYSDPKNIGNSNGRDERWVKLRTKGGHLIQMIDKGSNAEFDTYYKRLNKTEIGTTPDSEDKLGDDSRMIRTITRHGNMIVLDDRGSDPVSAENKSPHGNGVLIRTRKGHQLQMNDKPDLDHVMIATPKNQCFEMNDETQYIIISTSQSDELHTEVESNEITSKPPWIKKKGLVNDPEANTCHMKLDKINDYVRLKTPDGSGLESRGSNAPCGSWTEMVDAERRSIWLSKTDQLLLIRNKTGELYLALDDNDGAMLIRNEKDRIVIHAKKDIHFRSDSGNICFDAPSGKIGFTAKKMAAKTSGTTFVWDGIGFGSTKTVQGLDLKGSLTNKPSPRGDKPCQFEPKEISRKEPQEFDKERGCDPIKPRRGGVHDNVVNGGPGSGGGGAGGGGEKLPNEDPPPTSPTIPPPPEGPGPATPPEKPDPIEQANPGSGGVLWYGLSSIFEDEINDVGLLLKSLTNNLNTKDNIDADRIQLAKTLQVARGDKQAVKSQSRYGGKKLILRIRSVPDIDLLKPSDDDEMVDYFGDIPYDGNIEIFSIEGDEVIL